MSSCYKRPLAPVFFPRTSNGLPVATDGQMPDEEHRTSTASAASDAMREDYQCEFMYSKFAEVEKLKNMQLDQMNAKMTMQDREHKLRIHNLVSKYELALQKSNNQVTFQKQRYSISQEKYEQERNAWKEANSQVNKEVSDLKAELEKTKIENSDQMEKYEHEMNDWKEVNSQVNKEVSDLKAELEKTKIENSDAMEKYEQERNDWKEDNSQLNKEVSDIKAELEKTKNENSDAMEKQLNSQEQKVTNLQKEISYLKEKKNEIINAVEQKDEEMNEWKISNDQLVNQISGLSAEMVKKDKIIFGMQRKVIDLESKCDKQEKLMFVIGDLGTTKEERQKQQIENEPYPVYFQQDPQACMKEAGCQMSGSMPLKTVSPTGGIRWSDVVYRPPPMVPPSVPRRQGQENGSMSVKKMAMSPTFHVNQKGYRDVKTVSPTGGISIYRPPPMVPPSVPRRQGQENGSMSVKKMAMSPTFHVNQKGYRDVKEHSSLGLSRSARSLNGNDKQSMHAPVVTTND